MKRVLSKNEFFDVELPIEDACESVSDEIEVPKSKPKPQKSKPKPQKPTLRDEINAVVESTSMPFVGRADVARGLMLATLAGEHVLLIGPPGTAKSAITRHFVSHFDGASHFDWLLTKFSQPEEIFGPVSLKSMKAGRYERVPTGKLPEAEFAFLDEIFKANSSILNALLTAANERKWHDGTKVHDIPLRTIIGASNELPSEESLEAFFDRFLIRFNVQNVGTSRGAFMAVVSSSNAIPRVTIPKSKLNDAMAEVAEVDVSGVVDAMWQISSHLSQNHDITISDRRWKKAVKLVQAEAWLSGFDAAETEDLCVLRDVLWSEPEQIDDVHKAVDMRSSGEEGDLFEQVRALTDRFAVIESGGDVPRLAGFIRDAKRTYKEVRKAFEGAASRRRKKKIGVIGKDFQGVLKRAQEMVVSSTADEDFSF